MRSKLPASPNRRKPNRRPSPQVIRARRAEVARRYRRHRPEPDKGKIMAGRRRNEIEGLIHYRHGRLPDTDDRDTYLRFWAWHNLRSPRQEIELAWMCARLGADVPADEITAIVRYVQCRDLRKFSAKTLGKHLRLLDIERALLGITTIEAIDITPAERRRIRREQKRMRERQRRRAKGAKPRRVYEENSLTSMKPWKAEGISRATYYRRRERTRKPAVRQVRGQHLSNGMSGHTPVSTETPSVLDEKQEGLPRRSLDMDAMLSSYERLPIELRMRSLCLA
jgi:hypothetical protein